MKALSQKLLQIVDSATEVLVLVDEPRALEPIHAGGWTRKQLLGHLIDSASNNHQRFVRASLQDALNFPGYDQNGNVRAQQFQQAAWEHLVSLFTSYNRFLAHVIAHLPETKLNTLCRIGADNPVTLEALATDYVAHLSHHLGQLGVPIA
ncbi:MAG: DinB family protein [Acidobacteriota bacterium]